MLEKASFLRVFDGVVWGYLKAACTRKTNAQAAFYFSGSHPNALSGYLKPKLPPILFPFQHLPTLQFLQQQRFDFFRARLQVAGFFVVFEDFGVGKLGIQIGLFGFQRGDFVGQGVELALFFVRQLGRAVGLGFVFFRRPFGYLMQPESGVSTK